MFGRKARAIEILESDVQSLRNQRDQYFEWNSESSRKLGEANVKLVAEIEARIAAEDAVHLITHIACALADKKRPKKKR